MRYVLCVYSCNREPYNTLRDQLLQEPWMRKLLENPAVETYFVFADPTQTEATLAGDALLLPLGESYDRLSEKTYRMLEFFHERGEFDYLIKIDDSILANSATYRMRRIDPLQLCTGDYNGCDARFCTRGSIRRWAGRKGIDADTSTYPRLARIYTGKCYTLSRRAVAAVIAANAGRVPEMQRRFRCSEDLMVALALERNLLLSRDLLRFTLDAVRTKLRDLRWGKYGIGSIFGS